MASSYSGTLPATLACCFRCNGIPTPLCAPTLCIVDSSADAVGLGIPAPLTLAFLRVSTQLDLLPVDTFHFRQGPNPSNLCCQTLFTQSLTESKSMVCRMWPEQEETCVRRAERSDSEVRERGEDEEKLGKPQELSGPNPGIIRFHLYYY